MEDLAFIRAIRETPEDDALRLVYADWLDERGDPRGEFLRLQHSLVGLRKKESRIAIERRMEELRPSLNIDWLACVDRAERYTVYWTNDFCSFVAAAHAAGKPLRFVTGGQNQGSYFAVTRNWPGCYLYPVRVYEKKVYVIARMRVRQYLTRDDYRATHPESELLIENAQGNQILIGSEGTAIRFDLPLPPEALTRLRFQLPKKNKERALKHVRDGLMLHGSAGIDMVCRLTTRSAQMFDGLIARDYQSLPNSADKPWSQGDLWFGNNG
jgi:uncharacterized protein (TIGR02996 family)